MKKIYLLFLLLIIAPQACKASTTGTYDPGLLNSQHMKEFNIFERDTKLPEIFKEQPRPKSYYISTIKFEKNSSIPTVKLVEIIEEKIGAKLSQDDLLKMTQDLTKFYQDNGYKSAIVEVSDKNAEQGTIIFSIYEGPKKMFEQPPEPKL